MSPLSETKPEATLAWSGLTDPGRYRQNNEDSFLALTFDAREVRYLGKTGDAPMSSGDMIFAVSDGMGGANAGEFASRIAVDKITELLPKTFNLAAMGMDGGGVQILSELFGGIHNEMVSMSRYYEECRGMGATLSLCWFTPEWMHFAHIGDSRIYYLEKGGEMRQLTEDHTHVGWLLKQGKISESAARRHPKRNGLQQVLGGQVDSINPQLGSVGLQAGDRFVLCTDGINDAISDKRIETLIQSPPSRFSESPMANRLVKDAKEESGKDNLTAICVEALA